MAIGDILENPYDTEVEFVPGESPVDTKFNNWDALIEAAFALIMRVVGDITFTSQVTTLPAFITNLARAIGNLDEISPDLLNPSLGYFTTELSSADGAKEIILPYPPYYTGGDPSTFIVSSSDPGLIIAKYVEDVDDLGVILSGGTAAGNWAFVKDASGNPTKKIVTYSGLSSSEKIIFKVTTDGGLSNTDSYLNVIPCLSQITEDGVGCTVAIEGSGYRISFPTMTRTTEGTLLDTEYQVQITLPDWYQTLSESGSPYPEGLFMLWDSQGGELGTGGFIVDDDGLALTYTFPTTNPTTSVLISGTGLTLVGGSDRYALVVAGQSIAQAMNILKNELLEQDHAVHGQLIEHRHLEGLVPSGTSEKRGKYGFSNLGDHPDYLSREGYQATDLANNRNIMYGDIRFGATTPGTDGVGNYELDTSDSKGVTFGTGAKGIHGKYVGSGDYRIGIDGHIDQTGDSSNYYGIKNSGGANFLPHAIVVPDTGRTHAKNDADLRVYTTLDMAIANGENNILLEEGTHTLSAPLTITTQDVWIRGSGRSSILKISSTASPHDYMIKVGTGVVVAGFKLTDLTVDIRYVDSSKFAIELFSTNNALLQNIHFIDSTSTSVAYCVGIDTAADNTQIQYCSVGGVLLSEGMYGIYAVDANSFRITNCSFGSSLYPVVNALTARDTNCITTGKIGSKVFAFNHIYSSQTYSMTRFGIVDIAASTAGTNYFIVNNYFQGEWNNCAIKLTKIINIKVTENNISTEDSDNITGIGIYLDTCLGISLENNVIKNVGLDAIYSSDCGRLKISGNLLESVGITEVANGANIYIIGIEGSIGIFGNRILGPYVTADTYAHGIYISNSGSSNTFAVDILHNIIRLDQAVSATGQSYSPTGIRLQFIAPADGKNQPCKLNVANNHVFLDTTDAGDDANYGIYASANVGVGDIQNNNILSRNSLTQLSATLVCKGNFIETNGTSAYACKGNFFDSNTIIAETENAISVETRPCVINNNLITCTLTAIYLGTIWNTTGNLTISNNSVTITSLNSPTFLEAGSGGMLSLKCTENTVYLTTTNTGTVVLNFLNAHTAAVNRCLFSNNYVYFTTHVNVSNFILADGFGLTDETGNIIDSNFTYADGGNNYFLACENVTTACNGNTISGNVINGGSLFFNWHTDSTTLPWTEEITPDSIDGNSPKDFYTIPLGGGKFWMVGYLSNRFTTYFLPAA